MRKHHWPAVTTLKQRVAEFMTVRRGARFRAAYRRRHRPVHPLRAVLTVGAGLLSIALGLLLLVLPGPGLLLAALGAVLLAGESMLMARMLDRIDLRAQRCWRRWRERRGTLRR